MLSFRECHHNPEKKTEGYCKMLRSCNADAPINVSPGGRGGGAGLPPRIKI